MVNRELIEVFSEIAREKNVERSELGSIIESLFLHLVEKERGDASNCSVIVNLDKGEFEIYVEKEIVADVEDPVMEITLDEVAKIIKPGIKTDMIDKICFEFINDNKAYSAPLFYRGFPKSCCISTNHIVCHGIPKNKVLNEGDIVNVDVTAIVNEYYGDT